MIWMISANGKMYDHASSFATNGFIDWRQRAKYSIGDLVYIYCTRPFKRVMYKCEVVKHSMLFSDCVDDAEFWIDIDEYEKSKNGFYARLKLLGQVDTDKLTLDVLKLHGLSAAPQGPIRIDTSLHLYIDSCFDDFYSEGLFTDVPNDGKYHEGHVRSVKVDVYERSSIARRKCIDYHGLSCLICGLNFGDEYGSVGEGFIHVHHLRPLYTIKHDYVVNYKKDLIPVCPNCHAMIHRIPNGENMSVSEIKAILMKKSTDKGLIPQKVNKVEDNTKKTMKTDETSNPVPLVATKLKKGIMVKHKSLGIGTVVKIDMMEKIAYIRFSFDEKKFIFDAFEKGFLKMIE